MPGVEAFHRADSGYALQREGVGGDVGRDTVAPCLDSASTLLALPATIRQRRFGTVSSFITAPRAQGARMSQGMVRISSGSTTFAPNSATTRSTALLSTSVTINLA